MSEWTRGYVAAVDDMVRLAEVRGLATPALETLFADLLQDGAVIEHEIASKQQRRRLKAAREAAP